VQLGASTGLLGKIPGFKQFAQMKKLAGMDLGNVFGAGDPGAAAAAAGLPSMPGMIPPMAAPPGLPKGYTLPGTKSAAPAPAAGRNNASRNKDKRKRKEARKQRKKNR
jgi:hypothetical protein